MPRATRFLKQSPPGGRQPKAPQEALVRIPAAPATATSPAAAALRAAPPPPPPPPPRLLPLGALAAGFGLLHVGAIAQTAPTAPTVQTVQAARPAAAASAPRAAPETTMAPIPVRARAENDATSVRATTTTIGKGTQDLRDIPQSVTVITDKLLDDRRTQTLKEVLHQTGGVTFLAAEGGEEDIRLRGFSLATSGDIYVDSLRDPAFYDRDTFSYDRVELLRGSASMLFGRGSTGGVVNQVQKQAFLNDAHVVDFGIGTDRYVRFTGDFNLKLGDSQALRINVMKTNADNDGNFINKQGLALNYRFGIGSNDEFTVGGYYLKNDNGINYGLPWVRTDSASAASQSLIPGLDPDVYYSARSDHNKGGAKYGTLGWTHRFGDGGELKSAVRYGNYDRDQRASTIRFCVAPTCPGFTTPGANGPVFVTPQTPLTRGTQNKVQEMDTTYLQSDYSNKFKWFGFNNDVLTGIDLAHEEFRGYATVLPAGVTLDKNTPRTTIGTPNDGTGFVDETRRERRQQAAFDAKAVGIYAQDMLQLTDTWKLLAGLRWDKFKGSYQTLQTAGPTAQIPAPPPLGTVTNDRNRSDGLWSRRFGVLYQPTDTLSYHASYGTSFNTSGDAYQYDAPGTNTGPEASRNIEVGAKVELFEGRMSVRASAFHVTKYNERNRDSPTGTALPITEYLLSGKRHAAGIDLDLAGRITPQWEVFGSYAWIPSAKVDAGNPQAGTTESGERVGDRPSLTPRHSGTIWSTYQIIPALRLGAGLNARSSQTPNRNPAGIVAPKWVTGDLLAEYTFSDAYSVKINVLNVTNKYYADSLYTGHYIQGAQRSVTATVTARF